ncbi:diacylglycerol kinase [Streptomyces sp. NPDC058301]|uniref:diacylglycerol kinase n=1 Tax=Streptomyces sp. NPDC058301 TaxID=3346436 RepID=UPI0036E97B51
MSAADQLLVVIDPVARRIDGESVRIAKDVLCAGAQAKICWPEGVEEFSRALARRGGRRPVVVGDDRALLRTVTLLQRDRGTLDAASAPALSLVPVGTARSVEIARSLGVPMGAVAAARAVLDGAPRRLDLLVDESGGVVLGDLCIPAPVRVAAPTVWGTCRSLVRTLVRAPVTLPVAAAVAHRLRVEADGVLLSDLDRPVAGVSVGSGDGVAHVVIQPRVGAVVRVRARVVTVSVVGDGFRYRAGVVVGGPVRSRTWTAGSWTLTLPSPTPPVP